MEKNRIIEMYAKKNLIRAECEKLCRDPNLCDDLAQEVTIVMLEKPTELIEGLNERGELLYYIYRVAKNQYCSATSPFYTKYQKFINLTTVINE